MWGVRFFCRSWLASDKTRKPAAPSETAIAGKPAPTDVGRAVFL
jgi:hypothetical protein